MVNFYIHPREIDANQPRMKMRPFKKFKTYFNLKSTEKKLQKIMRDNEFTSFSDVVDFDIGDIDLHSYEIKSR